MPLHIPDQLLPLLISALLMDPLQSQIPEPEYDQHLALGDASLFVADVPSTKSWKRNMRDPDGYIIEVGLSKNV